MTPTANPAVLIWASAPSLANSNGYRLFAPPPPKVNLRVGEKLALMALKLVTISLDPNCHFVFSFLGVFGMECFGGFGFSFSML